MDRDEYERRVLLCLAEIVDLLSQLKHPSPMDGISGNPRGIADDTREAAYTYNLPVRRGE